VRLFFKIFGISKTVMSPVPVFTAIFALALAHAGCSSAPIHPTGSTLSYIERQEIDLSQDEWNEIIDAVRLRSGFVIGGAERESSTKISVDIFPAQEPPTKGLRLYFQEIDQHWVEQHELEDNVIVLSIDG
jgi:hypothetical protein